VILASIPVLLIAIGIVIALVAGVSTGSEGGMDTTLVHIIFFSGMFLALPFGILDAAVGVYARSKSLVSKKISIPGIVIGSIGILIGLLAWIFFGMVSSFVF
jgi:hypothetical protein